MGNFHNIQEFLEGGGQVGAGLAALGVRPNAAQQTFAVIGDSFANQSNLLTTLPAGALVRSNGVVTVTHASHPFYTGSKIGMRNTVGADCSNQFVTRISASQYSYPSPGADGVIAVDPEVSGYTVMAESLGQNGLAACLVRASKGRLQYVANLGCSGASCARVTRDFQSWLAQYGVKPTRMVWTAGYNDIARGISADATVAAVKAAVDSYPGALWDIVTPWPFGATATANSAANIRKVETFAALYRKAFAGYPNVRIIDSVARFVDSTTGLIKSQFVANDDTHPTNAGYMDIAREIVALPEVSACSAWPLPTSALNTRALDAASKNVNDNPLMSGTGGASSGGVTLTDGVPTGYTVALSANIGGTHTTPARADGFGDDIQVVMTSTATGSSTRVSYTVPTAYISPGQTLDECVAEVSVTGVAGQNIGAVYSQLAFTVDGVTYTVTENVGPAQTGLDFDQQDIVAHLSLFRNINIPAGSAITLLRHDVIVQFIGAGTCTLKVGRMNVRVA